MRHNFSLKLMLILLMGAPFARTNINQRFVPGASTATLTGTKALWQNPAGLAFLDGSESVAAYLYEWDQPGNRHHGAASLAINWWNILTLGAGINSRVALSALARHNVGTDLTGIGGIALRLGEQTGMGISFMKSHNFLAATSTSTMVSFGVQSRLTRYLALGANYEEVNDGYFGAPNISAGLGLRPLGEHLTLGLDGRWTALGQSFSDEFRFDPIFSVKAHYAGLGLNFGTEIPGLKNGWRKAIFSIGLDLNFAHWGISLASLINSASKNYGLGSSVRGSSAEWVSLKDPHGLWVELNMDARGYLENHQTGLASQLFGQEQSPLAILAMLKRLKSDPQIAGVIIYINGFSFGDGRTQEWRDALVALRQANKEVVVYLDNPTERDYFIATAANKIFMNNQATLSLQRFHTTLVHFADLLAKIGVKAEAVSAGAYKIATRPFTHAHAQKEEIEVYTDILSSFYENLLEETSKARAIPIEQLRSIFGRGDITAIVAQELKLVDHAIYKDEITTLLEHERGKPINLFANYAHRVFQNNQWQPAKKIAIIPIEGEIADGRVFPGLFSIFGLKVGALDIVDEIERAVEDPQVAGIIMRINSPGGTSSAGAQVHRALVLAQAQKPVVASMADVAASAGYLIAAGTNHILAERDTITGSIGVFSLHFSGETLAKKIGVDATEISVVENPGPNNFRGLSPSEKLEAQKIIDWSYQNFIRAVATGLELPEAEVRKSADGRVWLGHEAFTRKLVNEIGGFAQAIDAMRLLIEAPEPEELTMEIRKPGGTEVFSLGSHLTRLFTSPPALAQIVELKHLAQPYIKAIDCYRLEGVPQARLPFNISWE